MNAKISSLADGTLTLVQALGCACLLILSFRFVKDLSRASAADLILYEPHGCFVSLWLAQVAFLALSLCCTDVSEFVSPAHAHLGDSARLLWPDLHQRHGSNKPRRLDPA